MHSLAAVQDSRLGFRASCVFNAVRSISIHVDVREFLLRCEALYSSRARTHPQSIICVAMFSTTVHRTNIVQTLSES